MSHGPCIRILTVLLVACLLVLPAWADQATDAYEQAKDLYYEGKYEEALPIVENSLALYEKSSSAWNLKGLILMNLGRDREALSAYNRSIELKPNSHIAYNNKGLAHKHLGEYPAALEAFDASTRINPTYTFAYFNKGNLQMLMGDFEDALRSLESALSYDPHYAQAWNSKGLVYQKMDDHGKAVEQFSQAIIEDPGYKEAWYNKGISLSRLGRPEEAADAFSQALMIDPSYSEAKIQRDLVESKAVTNSTLFAGTTPSFGGGTALAATLLLLVLASVGVGLFMMRSRKPGGPPIREGSGQPASGSGFFREKATISRDLPGGDLQGVVHGPDTGLPPEGSAEAPLSGEPAPAATSPAPPAPAHHDVFISYSSQDKQVADAVCAALEAKRIRCWIAPRDILPGTLYQEGIIRAIEDCRIMVFIFSSHSNNSPHIIRELTKAVSTGAIIIPFRIEDVIPSKSMEYLIGAPHWLDALTPPLEAHVTRLVSTIERLLSDR